MPRRKSKDIDAVLKGWPYEPGELSVRLVQVNAEREVLQMRVDMGVLQLEVDDRPDGERPGGAATYFDHLLGLSVHEGDDFELTDSQCQEIDREFLQFYHRRICWLQLRDFARAVRDADHSLALMDFSRQHSSSDEWTEAHERYRPYILFHRTQAAAFLKLEERGAEAAIETIARGLESMRASFQEFQPELDVDDDEMVKRLKELREELRGRFHIGRTLQERLSDAIAAEQYELAAQLRDELKRRR